MNDALRVLGKVVCQTGNVFEPGFCCQQNIVSVFIPGRDIRSGIGKHFNMPQKSLPAYKFINSGKGGNTIGGGLARLESAVLKHRAAYLIIGRGANDYWRGKRSLSELEKDYDLILSRCSSSGMKIVIISCFGNEKLPQDAVIDFNKAGIPREHYAAGLAVIERKLAKKYQAGYVPDMQCAITPKGRPTLWSEKNTPTPPETASSLIRSCLNCVKFYPRINKIRKKPSRSAVQPDHSSN